MYRFPWLDKKQKATISLINDDDKCLIQWSLINDQHTATVALNHRGIGRISQRISKVKPFINITGEKKKITHPEKMTRKSLRKIIQRLFLMLYVKKIIYILSTCLNTS